MEVLKTNEVYHTPVLLEETLKELITDPNGVYVDLTFGGGGHSRAILSQLSESGRLYSFDQDLDALENRIDDERFVFVRSNFRYLRQFVDYYGIEGRVSGILADLGVSSHHFDAVDRGFTFRDPAAPLDMRMNREAKFDAREVLMLYPEERLSDVFYRYGEFKQAKRLARAIVSYRQEGELSSTGELLSLVEPLLDKRQYKRQLGQIYQALRIEVNQELTALEEMLRSTSRVLSPLGRLAVITYHSLEDRLVKQFLKEEQETTDQGLIYGGSAKIWTNVSSKPILPGEDEIARNPRSRSAKLRVAQLNPIKRSF